MTEWNALGYAKISALQQAMAAEVLALLEVKDARSVLDLGCGNGTITAEIAARIQHVATRLKASKANGNLITLGLIAGLLWLGSQGE